MVEVYEKTPVMDNGFPLAIIVKSQDPIGLQQSKCCSFCLFVSLSLSLSHTHTDFLPEVGGSSLTIIMVDMHSKNVIITVLKAPLPILVEPCYELKY